MPPLDPYEILGINRDYQISLDERRRAKQVEEYLERVRAQNAAIDQQSIAGEEQEARIRGEAARVRDDLHERNMAAYDSMGRGDRRPSESPYSHELRDELREARLRSAAGNQSRPHTLHRLLSRDDEVGRDANEARDAMMKVDLGDGQVGIRNRPGSEDLISVDSRGRARWVKNSPKPRSSTYDPESSSLKASVGGGGSAHFSVPPGAPSGVQAYGTREKAKKAWLADPENPDLQRAYLLAGGGGERGKRYRKDLKEAPTFAHRGILDQFTHPERDPSLAVERTQRGESQLTGSHLAAKKSRERRKKKITDFRANRAEAMREMASPYHRPVDDNTGVPGPRIPKTQLELLQMRNPRGYANLQAQLNGLRGKKQQEAAMDMVKQFTSIDTANSNREISRFNAKTSRLGVVARQTADEEDAGPGVTEEDVKNYSTLAAPGRVRPTEGSAKEMDQLMELWAKSDDAFIQKTPENFAKYARENGYRGSEEGPYKLWYLANRKLSGFAQLGPYAHGVPDTSYDADEGAGARYPLYHRAKEYDPEDWPEKWFSWFNDANIIKGYKLREPYAGAHAGGQGANVIPGSTQPGRRGR
mgnify:CR=1 FL=1